MARSVRLHPQLRRCKSSELTYEQTRLDRKIKQVIHDIDMERIDIHISRQQNADIELYLADCLHKLDREIKAGDLERVETRTDLGRTLEDMKDLNRMTENMDVRRVENMIKFRHRLEDIAEKAKKSS